MHTYKEHPNCCLVHVTTSTFKVLDICCVRISPRLDIPSNMNIGVCDMRPTHVSIVSDV